MIYIKNLTLNTYEPDIRPLINSFFPGERIEYVETYSECPDTLSNADDICSSVSVHDFDVGEKEKPDNSASEEDLSHELKPENSIFLDIDDICNGIKRSDDRFYDKSAVKSAVYKYLSELTGRTLPWGTLTGIRPVRIAEKYENELCCDSSSDEGSDQKHIDSLMKDDSSDITASAVCNNLMNKYLRTRRLRELMKNDFLISDEKLDLMLDIYAREKSVLSAIDYKNGYSIYIGIPFCPTRCVYCSFTAYPYHLWEHGAEEYIERIGEELADITALSHGGILDANALLGKKLQTIYIGGGTPSVLSAELIEKLMCTIESYVDIQSLAEFTFEAGRPDTITREKLEVLKRHGVTRISINPQTMCQKTLDLIGRKHTVEQIRDTFRLAREMGFDNINMDIIAGLPGENIDDFRYTLSEIGRLDPDNLTVHTLAVKRASRLNTEGNAWGGMDRKGLDESGINEVLQMTELGAGYAAEHGLYPYYMYRQKNMAGSLENIGYAKPGTENLYNLLMMEERHSVISCGAGSSTKRVNADGSVERCENVKDIKSYLERTEEMLERKRRLLEQ